MAYITTDELQAYGGYPDGDVALLTALIARATSIIETYTHRVFEKPGEEATRYYDEDSVDDTVLLLDADLLEESEVKIDEDEVTDYKPVPRNDTPIWGLVRTQGWSCSDEVSVKGYWSFSETPPDDIKHAAIRLVDWLYKQRSTSEDLDRPYLTPGGVMVMPSRLPTDIAMLLDPYKRLVIA